LNKSCVYERESERERERGREREIRRKRVKRAIEYVICERERCERERKRRLNTSSHTFG